MKPVHTLALALSVVLPALSSASAHPSGGRVADIGPRRPMRQIETRSPGDWMTMEEEAVEVRIQGHEAKVRARFHFDASKVFRASVAMRLAFPELVADAPLHDFKVQQAAGMDHVYPETSGTPPASGQGTAGINLDRPLGPVEPVTITSEDASAAPMEGFQVGEARYKTWGLVLAGSRGRPPEWCVTSDVSYRQALADLPGGKLRYRYVLRSGAPWAGPIGKATIRIYTGAHKVIKATAGSTRGKGMLAWNLTSFEPAQDLEVELEP